MTVNRDTLIKLTRQVLEESLGVYGFVFSEEKFQSEFRIYGGEFGFYKKAKDFDMYLFIEFQPSGFSINEILKVFVNLYRTKANNLNDYPAEPSGKVQKIATRMNPHLFQESYQGPGWEWSAAFEDKAKAGLADILHKIENYAIPFLEDPRSSVDPHHAY